MQETIKTAVKQYLGVLELQPGGEEIQYRTSLENLLASIQLPARNFTVIQEDRRSGIEIDGTPDFFVYEDWGAAASLFKRLVGFIECKKPSKNIGDIVDSEQVKKYSKTCENIILTNYRRFILLQRGRVVHDIILSGSPQALVDFGTLLFDFYQYDYEYIKTKKVLAATLAAQSFYYSVALREFIAESDNSGDSFYIKFNGLFREFETSVNYHYELPDFCDVYSQSLVYGLMLARLDTGQNLDEKDLDYLRGIPADYRLLYEFLSQGYESRNLPAPIRVALTNIGKNINLINKEAIEAEFTRGGSDRSSIAVYLYEDFLAQYDKLRKTENRKENGVYYTPREVTEFIARSVDDILKANFGLQSGFAAPGVKILDFACGTGTFLHSIFDLMLSGETDDLTRRMVQEKIVHDIYGFELLFTPYIIAHTFLTRFLANKGICFGRNERLGVYLTNTLDIGQHSISAFLPQLKMEHEKAMRIKGEEEILAIVGNPPYFNGKSRAKKGLIDAELREYKEGLNEKKLNLDDMYIKFIRFAEWKIEKCGHGVAGIITNNSYLDGPTHRKMREHLYKTFDEIYIVNLHGNSRKKDNDKNIFDIMVGVAIIIFVKLKEPAKRKKVRYFSTLVNGLITRAEKLRFLENTKFNRVDWTALNPAKTEEFWFVPKDFSEKETYKKFWKLTDIFKEYNSGIKNDRDDLVVDYSKAELAKKMKIAFSGEYSADFKERYKIENSSSYAFVDKLKTHTFDAAKIREIQYRIWDTRYIYYAVGFTSRPAENVMRQFERENIGLQFQRIIDTGIFKACFVSNTLIDVHTLCGQGYIAPLYIYCENADGEHPGEITRIPNFTEHFANSGYLAALSWPGKPSPEEVLAYIYAVLHSPEYRTRYVEFLKTDFPAVPMTKDRQTFYKYAALGQKLIDLHLLRNVPASPEIKVSLGGVKGDFVLKKTAFANGRLLLGVYASGVNAAITIDGVTGDVYDFEIGSYKPIEKWLKYRVKDGVSLGVHDLSHLKNMIAAIKGTIAVMAEIGALGEAYLK
jgi:type I restriction-modification system DNA methylase subunit